MSKEIKVEKIIIKVGQKEIPLTVSEAKELQQVLEKTFGGVREIIYPQPIVIERPVYPPYRWWQVTWDTKASTMYCCNK